MARAFENIEYPGGSTVYEGRSEGNAGIWTDRKDVVRGKGEQVYFGTVLALLPHWANGPILINWIMAK